MKQVYFTIVLILTALSNINAQEKKDTVTNTTVVQLKNAGLSSDIIKAKIQNSLCLFILSTDSLIALKKASVTDDVINVMLSKSTSVQPAEKAVEYSPGIYYAKGSSTNLVELDASLYAQSKSGSGLLTSLTYGIAKTKGKAILSGGKANLQIENDKPVFYFYFDKTDNKDFGRMGSPILWFSAATTPNEFMLISFSTSSKSREVVTGSWSSYSGMSSGISDRNKVKFRYEKVAQGVYKVYTDEPLDAGEYCFMYAGGTANISGAAPIQKVYDFGITKKKKK